MPRNVHVECLSTSGAKLFCILLQKYLSVPPCRAIYRFVQGTTFVNQQTLSLGKLVPNAAQSLLFPNGFAKASIRSLSVVRHGAIVGFLKQTI